MEAGSADRYAQESAERGKSVPEGIEGQVPYKGPLGGPGGAAGRRAAQRHGLLRRRKFEGAAGAQPLRAHFVRGSARKPRPRRDHHARSAELPAGISGLAEVLVAGAGVGDCSLPFSTGFHVGHSSRIIIPILHWLLPRAATATLLEIHHVIRKCGHFTEYFVLSLLILRGIRAGRPDARIAWALAAIAIVACYASLDELHQSFVPGRTPAIADVLLDTVGALCAQIAFALSMSKRTAPCNQERAESP